MSALVRRAELQDAPRIAALRADLCSEGAFPGTWEPLFDRVRKELCTLRELLNTPRCVALTAVLGPCIVGWLHFEPRSRAALAHWGLLELAVGVPWRRQGIGRLLLSTFLQWADHQEGLRQVRLECLANNSVALGMYSALGFVEEGRRLASFAMAEGTFADVVLMRRDLLRCAS